MSVKRLQILILYSLVIFALFRPLASTYYFSELGIFALNIREIFALGISYCMLIAIFINGVPYWFGTLEFMILAFVFYGVLSVVWGSDVRELTRLLFPFIPLFAIRSIAGDKRRVKLLFTLLVVSFAFPVIWSCWLIMSGSSVAHTVYWTGLERFAGVYIGSHTLAHEMLIFVFIVILLNYMETEEGGKSKILSYCLFFLSVLAMFNIYKSYTRTVYLGLTTVFAFILFGHRRYGLLAFMAPVIAGIFMLSSTAQTIFWDVIRPLEQKAPITMMGQGRIGLWLKSMAIFLNQPGERYFLGMGLGQETLGAKIHFGASHNDLISLLLGLGIVGLLLYFAIILVLFKDIITSDLNRPLKYTYLGFLVAVVGMNFASNSYLSRFGLAQYFFFIMGSFYVIKNDNIVSQKDQIK